MMNMPDTPMKYAWHAYEIELNNQLLVSLFGG